MTNSKKAKRFQFWINVVLILITLSIILPFVLVFISSLTDENTLIRNGYSFFPQSNYLFRILYDAVQRRTGADLLDVCKVFSHQKHDLGIDCSGLPVKCKQRADDPKLL